MTIVLVIFATIWCILGLIPWFWIVNDQGYIDGQDIFMFPFLVIFGVFSLMLYWLEYGDQIHIELPWRKND